MKIKTELLNFSQRTTVHGITNIFNANNFIIRSIWAFNFLLAIMFCLITIRQNFNDYFSFKTISKIEITKIKGNDQTIDYPVVTICNLEICGFDNYDYKTYINKYIKDKFIQEKFKGSQSEIIMQRLKKSYTKKSFYDLGQDIFLEFYSQKKLYKIFSRKNSTDKLLRPFLISCLLNNKENCEAKYQIIRLGSYRDCYQFKLNWTDLKFEFYLGNVNECKSPFSSSSGLFAYIHSPIYKLTEKVSNDILVQPGTHTSIGISLTKIKKLPKPFSDCIDINHNFASLQKSVN